MSASGAAALLGGFGLQADITSNSDRSVGFDLDDPETRFRARFYFDPNSIPMAAGNSHRLFHGYAGSSTPVVRVELRYSSGDYQLRAAIRNDGSTWTSTGWNTITDAAHFVELDWRAATAAGANDGALTFWIDGAQVDEVTGIDNDTRTIDRFELGPVDAVDSGTRGAYYFDSFEARRETYIGP
jgi:hypothetical protein